MATARWKQDKIRTTCFRRVCWHTPCKSPPHSLSFPIQKLCKHPTWVDAQRLSNLDELDDIEPTLSTFIFCNKGLGTPKTTGDFLLRETLINARPVQQFLKLPLVESSYRFWHRMG